MNDRYTMTPASARGPVPLRMGFTLMETLAAVLITSLVVTFAMSAYIQIAETAELATQRLRDDLHATTILDRISSDLESAVLLVKPDEVDPLRHPWYFVAESGGTFDGSDALRFVGRKNRSYHGDQHSSDFAEIAYQVETDDEGLQTLYRWLAPGLPDEYQPVFPPIDDERSFILGEGLSGFALRFSNGEGEWVESWDSTLLTQSSLLPVSVEIRFDMGVPEDDGGSADEARYQRRIVLPMRPIDLDAMVTSAREIVAGGTGATDDEDDASDDDVFACVLAYCRAQQDDNPLCAQAPAEDFWSRLDDAQRTAFAVGTGCD